MKICITFCAAALLAACSSGRNTLPAAIGPASTNARTDASLHYRVIDLGTLGGAGSGASSINNRSWISGLSALSTSSYIHAALWRGHSKADLGTLGGPNSAIEWPVKNVDGLLAGISETNDKQRLGEIWSCALGFFPQPPSGHICRGFSWENGKMTALPTLGGNNGFAAGANDAGEIVGWAETAQHDSTCVKPQVLQFEAALYEPRKNKIAELPPLAGDKDGAATEINDEGQVVGISGICDQAEGRFTARHAVLWQDGTIVNLGTLGGVAWNTPMAINDLGQVAGFSDLAGDKNGNPKFHAFFWTKQSGIHDLGTLPGDAYSEALGINNRGQIVGVSYGAGFATSRAFLWQHGTMTDLNTLIPTKSMLSLLFANDINDQGEIAGGACVLVSGTCGSTAPAFAAVPKGNDDELQLPATSRPVPLPAWLRELMRHRALAF